MPLELRVCGPVSPDPAPGCTPPVAAAVAAAADAGAGPVELLCRARRALSAALRSGGGGSCGDASGHSAAAGLWAGAGRAPPPPPPPPPPGAAAELARTAFGYRSHALAAALPGPLQAAAVKAGGPGAAALARSPFSIESLIGRTRGPAAAGAHVSSGAASGTAPGPGGGGCAVQAAAGPAVALTRSLVVAAAAAASSVSSSAALGTLHQGTALSSVENFTARISNC